MTRTTTMTPLCRAPPASRWQHLSVVAAFLLGVETVSAFSLSTSTTTTTTTQSISFPLKTEFNLALTERMTSAFEAMVASTEFIHRDSSVHCDNNNNNNADTANDRNNDPPQFAVYKIPLFGEDCRLTFEASQEELITGTSTSCLQPEYVLKVDGATSEDFGWLCLKVYESRSTFENDIDMINLRDLLFQHMNQQPPSPGQDASIGAVQDIKVIFQAAIQDSSCDYQSPDEVLDTLSRDGFVVLDTLGSSTITSLESNQKLSKLLLHKTGQAEQQVRTDTVAFLNADDAKSCGLQPQFDLLMSLASYLNQNLNLDLEPSVHAPIPPATRADPLTNPQDIQAAEYGQGDYYVPHSDNSYETSADSSTKTRLNYRAFTAILYCNDDWQASDGGALRIYKESTQLARAKDAPTTCEHYDVVPTNGRLVIFDSRLVHSVEAVQVNKSRRALTIWIHRPTEEPVRGEIIDVPP